MRNCSQNIIKNAREKNVTTPHYSIWHLWCPQSWPENPPSINEPQIEPDEPQDIPLPYSWFYYPEPYPRGCNRWDPNDGNNTWDRRSWISHMTYRFILYELTLLKRNFKNIQIRIALECALDRI